MRGEEPVFVVTGRKEDVTKAKKEILSAAEHFSQIRASRKNMAGTLSPPGPPTVPGHVTIQVSDLLLVNHPQWFKNKLELN